MKKIYISIIAIIMISSLFLLTGCDENNETKTTSTNKKVVSSVSNQTEENTNLAQSSLPEVDYKVAAEKQMSMPEVGDTVAIIKVKNFGEIKVKFFEDVAPKAVENFTTHAKNGYYDGLIFHRVINEFMIQGGDPTGTGTGGESIWGEGFGTEISEELVPYRGSLCMAMSSLPNSIGSQFFITQANYDEYTAKMLKAYYPNEYSDELLQEYKTYGGYLSLYKNYTVFGQVYEGLEVLDSIASVKTGTVPLVIDGVTYGEQADKPIEDVVIEKIEITTYKGK